MKNELKTYVSHIENYLDGCFDFYEFEPQTVLFDSMRYSLLAGRLTNATRLRWTA